jgi:hypothetical protein
MPRTGAFACEFTMFYLLVETDSKGKVPVHSMKHTGEWKYSTTHS